MKAAGVAAVVALLVLAGGCSLVVPSDVGTVRCSQPGVIGPPACGPGQICNAGDCVACQKTDICGDGVDNDCNGIVDDGCADGGAGLPVGGPCGSGGDCAAGLFCLDLQAVLGQSGQPFCTRSCCTSSDCGSGDAVCWPTPAGGAVCRRASGVGRATPGTGATGATCSNDKDCRSGACGTDGVCIDTCCGDGDCPSNAALSCALGPLPGVSYQGFYCSHAGNRGYEQPCGSDSECRSRVCMSTALGGLCSQPCCRSTDCGMVIAGVALVCAYSAKNGQIARVCRVAGGGAGSAVSGAPCGRDRDCRSGKCLDFGGKKLCSDACCRDADCGNPKVGCRPVSSGGTYVLRCVPL